MLAHLRRICDHLSSDATLEEGIQLIAIHACYSGHSARLFVGQFHQDLQIRQIASFGFQSDVDFTSAYESALLPKLIEESIQSHSIIFKKHDSEYRVLFRSAVGVDDDPVWKTTVLMPLLPSYFATLSLVVDDSIEEANYEYYETVRSILNLYLTLKLKNRKVQAEIRSTKGNSTNNSRLTERQELILEMIKAGQTNRSIADRLGYSESLIRLESIAIYRKLGIEGRRDLDIM